MLFIQIEIVCHSVCKLLTNTNIFIYMCFTNVNEVGIRYQYFCIQLTNVQISIKISQIKIKKDYGTWDWNDRYCENRQLAANWYNNKHVKLFLFLFGPVNLHSDSWILQLKKSEWLVGQKVFSEDQNLINTICFP
jgi:hypothetical protein